MVRPIALALLITACRLGAAAAPDSRSTPPQVVLCRTTEVELRAALGPPTRDGVFHRAHILSWILGDEPVVRYLAVMVDDAGVVIDQVWNVPTEIPWTPTDQCGASSFATTPTNASG